MAYEVNLDVAMEQYHKRKAANAGKQIDNSALVAGAPMFYYCKFCGAPTEALPEGHLRAPVTTCHPCQVLHDHGLV